MKILRLSLMALALTVGLAAAFANAKTTHGKGYFTSFYYVPVTGVPSQNGGSTFTGTRPDAQTFYGCAGSTTLCAHAYQATNHAVPVTSADIYQAP